MKTPLMLDTKRMAIHDGPDAWDPGPDAAKADIGEMRRLWYNDAI